MPKFLVNHQITQEDLQGTRLKKQLQELQIYQLLYIAGEAETLD